MRREYVINETVTHFHKCGQCGEFIPLIFLENPKTLLGGKVLFPKKPHICP